MHLPTSLLHQLKLKKEVYLPGVGIIRLTRITSSYQASGKISPPCLALELVSSGANSLQKDSDFYKQHPEILEWAHREGGTLAREFALHKQLLFVEVSSFNSILPVAQSGLTKSAAPVIVQAKQFKLRRLAAYLLVFAMLFGIFQRNIPHQFVAFLGVGVMEIPDFKEELLSIENKTKLPTVSNPYFRKNTISSESFVLVSGVFSKEENARKWMIFLNSKGLPAAMIPGPSGLIRVCSLPIATDFEAVHLMDEWRKNHGISTWILPI